MFTVTTMTMRTAKLVTPAVTTAAVSIAAIDMKRTLTQLPFWPSLTEQEQETLRRSAFVRHYEKGAFVHSSDNDCLGMMFVLSGEIRTSNFLLWQSAYAEYYFTDVLWPDFDEPELDKAIASYQKRERRFGGRK